MEEAAETECGASWLPPKKWMCGIEERVVVITRMSGLLYRTNKKRICCFWGLFVLLQPTAPYHTEKALAVLHTRPEKNNALLTWWGLCERYNHTKQKRLQKYFANPVWSKKPWFVPKQMHS
jgi:hypothetical protein